MQYARGDNILEPVPSKLGHNVRVADQAYSMTSVSFVSIEAFLAPDQRLVIGVASSSDVSDQTLVA